MENNTKNQTKTTNHKKIKIKNTLFTPNTLNKNPDKTREKPKCNHQKNTTNTPYSSH